MGENRVEHIVRSLNEGEITREEAARQLQAIIDRELSGPVDAPADMDTVKRCQDLLWEWNTKGMPYRDQSPASRQQLENRLKAHPPWTSRLALALRLLCTAAALAVLVTGLSMVRLRYFEWSAIWNGEQVEIQGREHFLSRERWGVADEKDDHRVENFSTASLDETIAFMGFDPGFPDEMPGGYALSWYEMGRMPEYRMCTAVYAKEDRYLTVDLFRVQNWNEFRTTYEQNEAGGFIRVDDLNVYTAYNYENRLLLFSRGDDLYAVCGLYSHTDDATIVRSLMKGADTP